MQTRYTHHKRKLFIVLYERKYCAKYYFVNIISASFTVQLAKLTKDQNIRFRNIHFALKGFRILDFLRAGRIWG